MAVVGNRRCRPALALKFGLDVRDINSQLDQYRRFQCMAIRRHTAICDVNGKPAQPLH